MCGSAPQEVRPPSPLLAVLCTPLSAPRGPYRDVFHRVRAAGGGGGPTTASLSAPGTSAVAWASAPMGPGLLLAATGGHYVVHTAFLPRRVCSLPAFPRHGHVLWKHPHCLFLLHAHTGWGADITSGEGSGQLVPVWAGMSLKRSGPSQTTPMPQCIASLPQRACAAAQSSRARVEDFL